MKDCPRCHGSGEIGWNDSPINDPQCAQEATCNVCHGEGVVMMEPSSDPIGDRDEAVMAEHFETLEACTMSGCIDGEAVTDSGQPYPCPTCELAAENERLKKLCGPDPERVGDLLVRTEVAEAQLQEERELRRTVMDRVEELEVALKDAIEFADEGWAYASPYFVEKWDYKGQREKLQAALKGEK